MSKNKDLNVADQDLEMKDESSKEKDINNTGPNQSNTTCSSTTTSTSASAKNKGVVDDDEESRNVRQKRSRVIVGEFFNIVLDEFDGREEARLARCIWDWLEAQEFYLTGDPLSNVSEENNCFNYMSYEELLDIKEQFKIIDRGLCESAIEMVLDQFKFSGKTKEEEDYGLCCICKEAYISGKVISRLDCGHVYHFNCIKSWLTRNNICPICKDTAVNF